MEQVTSKLILTIQSGNARAGKKGDKAARYPGHSDIKAYQDWSGFDPASIKGLGGIAAYLKLFHSKRQLYGMSVSTACLNCFGNLSQFPLIQFATAKYIYLPE